MGTRGNRIQLYITMGTVFSVFLRWRPFAMADRNLFLEGVLVAIPNAAIPNRDLR